MDLKQLERPGVYVIFHVASGRSYVGSSVNVRVRRKTHLGALRHGRHYNGYLQRVWTKYGEEAFRFHVLEFVDRDDVLRAEQKWIDAIRPVFNLLPLAGSPRGFKLTAEQRAKISESNRRRMHNVTPERLEAMRQQMREIREGARLGTHHSEATIEAMRQTRRGKPSPLKGKKRSLEFREKIAASKRGKKQPPDVVAARAARMTGKKRGPYNLSPEERERRRLAPLGKKRRKADTQPS